MTERLNAYIKSTSLGYEDGGIFSFRLCLDIQDGCGCCVGGYAMDGYSKLQDKRVGSAYGMDLIIRILEVVGVRTWEELKGKYIRVESPGLGGRITKIGNLMKNDWVDFDTFGKGGGEMTFNEWFRHKVETKIFDDTPATRYIAEAAYGAGMKDICLKDPEIKNLQNLLIEANSRNMDNLETIKELNKENEKLNLYRRAFCLFVHWAEECDFGYDNLGELADKYEKELDDKGFGYIEGLMMIAIKEAKENFPKLYLKEIENVEKGL